jgi:hypothetical protein
MILFILFLVAVSVAMVVSINRSQTINQAQLELESNKVLGTVTDRINTVYLEGDGFRTNVTLPERIMGFNYTLYINSNQVLLYLRSTLFIKNILTDNVTGELANGINVIENDNGRIVIKEAS